MFTDMRIAFDDAALYESFARWLDVTMPSGAYHAWIVETTDGNGGAAEIVGGGGATILPWSPGPDYPGDKLAFVYNVYVDPAHRRRGVARLVMETIHAFCRHNGIGSIALNASEDGRGLYESLGYQVTPSPMMFFAVVGV